MAATTTRKVSLALVWALILAASAVLVPARAVAAVTARDAGSHLDESAVGATAPTESRGDIIIRNDEEFTADRGVRKGRGTARSPYVISGWNVANLSISNTTKRVVIKNNEVRSRMTLDWIGKVKVTNNTVGDLRVNQNNQRTGPMTQGTIANNKFSVVGQLRHWDGVFERNAIGSSGLNETSARAVNFDGFNGGRFRNNTIYGYVDVKLHGHHHSSRFGGNSHDHAGGYDAQGEPMAHHGSGTIDHSRRYHNVFITNNTIHSDSTWALRYYDRNHTGDDRTANSEPNKNLNCPHVHFTKAYLNSNKLVGASLMIDVFNAADDNHWGTMPGLVEIKNNHISLARDRRQLLDGRFGIVVQEATDLTLQIRNNRIDGANSFEENNDPLSLERNLNAGAGILLVKIDKAKIYVIDNEIAFRRVGIQAAQFNSNVKWWVRGLSTIEVDQDIKSDGTVPKPKN